ncbi:MAG: hypothetical protein HN929_12555 [Chloroflexi bacterium]|jgi:hypothetical protein|nr:hypothetical protein [Chloroflexota bacterium]
MYLIFLDIDGVLNNAQHQRKGVGGRGRAIIPGIENRTASQIAPENVIILKEIIKEIKWPGIGAPNWVDDVGNDVKIVVSSAWRIGHSVEQLDYMLESHGIWTSVIDKTSSNWPLDEYKYVSEDLRTRQVAEWFADFPIPEGEEIEGFIVIDDSHECYPNVHKHFLHTTWDLGLTEEHIKQAAEIFALPIEYDGMGVPYGLIEDGE